MLIKQAAAYYGTGPKMGINPRFSGAAGLAAHRQDASSTRAWRTWPRSTARTSYRGRPGDVVTVPDWTDVNDWAAVVDPKVIPAIFVGERFGVLPEVFIAGDSLSPAVFMNDETRLKVRQFVAVWVNDFRPLANNHV